MSDKKETTTGIAKTLGSVSSLISFLEKATIAFFMALLEYTRIKQKKAEDELANEKSETKIKEDQDVVSKSVEGKSSVSIIDGFLSEHDKPKK